MTPPFTLTADMAEEICDILNEERQFGIRSDTWLNAAIAAVQHSAISPKDNG